MIGIKMMMTNNIFMLGINICFLFFCNFLKSLGLLMSVGISRRLKLVAHVHRLMASCKNTRACTIM